MPSSVFPARSAPGSERQRARRLGLILAVCLCWLGLGAARLAAQTPAPELPPPLDGSVRAGPGVIEGVIIPGTADAALAPGLTVTLDGYVRSVAVVTLQTTTDADGAFRFTDLAVDDAIVYRASVSAEGIRYTGPLVRLRADAPQATTSIVVYAATGEPTALQLDRVHWVIESEPGALIVGQLYVFGLAGDRALVGRVVEGVDVPVTVGLMIPAGAEAVTLEQGALGDRFRRVGNLIYDTMPMLPGPGVKQIMVRYALPYTGATRAVSQEFLYPVTHLTLLIADLPALHVEVDGMTEAESLAHLGRTYHSWRGSDLAPGAVHIRLQGLVPAGLPDPRDVGVARDAAGAPRSVTSFAPWMLWASGAFLAVALAGVAAWAWRRGRHGPHMRRDPRVLHDQELLQEIARLDDLVARGELDEQAWAAQRTSLKAALLDAAQRLTPSRTWPSDQVRD